MKLANATLRPGTITKVLNNGKIKASVPGLFMKGDEDKNPEIMPFFEICGDHANHFSTPVLGENIWVINTADNPRELYWFRKDKHIENNQFLFDEGGVTNVEILCNRNGANGWATIYFSDGSGWILRYNQDFIQIAPDSSITIKSSTGCDIILKEDKIYLHSSSGCDVVMQGDNIDITSSSGSAVNIKSSGETTIKSSGQTIDVLSGSISIGSPGKSVFSAACGEPTVSTFSAVSAVLTALKSAASGSPYTAHLASALDTSGITSASQTIPSKTISIN